MDYNVRMENICVNRSLVSLCLSPVRQSSALSSLSISLLCPGASQHESTRHTHRIRPTRCLPTGLFRPAAPGATSTWSDPPAWRLPGGLLHLARRIVARRGGSVGPHQPAAAPPSYPPGATSIRPPRRSRRAGGMPWEHEPEPLSHETTALPGSAVN